MRMQKVKGYDIIENKQAKKWFILKEVSKNLKSFTTSVLVLCRFYLKWQSQNILHFYELMTILFFYKFPFFSSFWFTKVNKMIFTDTLLLSVVVFFHDESEEKEFRQIHSDFSNILSRSQHNECEINWKRYLALSRFSVALAFCSD